MDKIILTTQTELRDLIYEVLKDYFKENKIEQETESSDSMNMEAAIIFLRENGFPTSKATMYRYTSTGKIPFGRYGNKLVFSKKTLIQWAQQRTTKFGENNTSEEFIIANKRLLK